MMKILFLITLFFSIFCPASANIEGTQPQEGPSESTVIQIKNDSLAVSIDLWGGAFVNLKLTGNSTNPLDWKIPQHQMPENNRNGAPFQGHFLCFGRWGGPTEGETKAGIPHNGEPANRTWQQTEVDAHHLKMKVDAPLEKWTVNRTVRLSENQPCFMVEESFTNSENYGRFTTVVQHATFGGEFLGENTIVNSNAGDGFNQSLISNSLTEHAYSWPIGYIDSLKNTIDFRKNNSAEGYVTTHIIDEEIGWATVASPLKNLLVGYVWKTEDYPWLHVWHGTQNGKLWAKGIEFGTTGLGDTFTPEERMKNSFRGRQNYFFVDARSGVEKSYICFLIPVDKTFVKTESIEVTENRIEVVIEKSTGKTTHLFRTNF